MLYNVSALLFLLVIAAANTNSQHRFKSTQKPDILVDPLLSKASDQPTHISEFTDPDTGFNPFLDLEEGPTFIGRNVMKDETRQDPPFMDFNIMEGDASNRRWLELDVSKEPIEESVSRWVPFEEEIKLEDFNFQTTVQSQNTEIEQTTLSWTETFDSDILNGTETSNGAEENLAKELPISMFSNAAVIYISVALVILAIVILILGSCWYKRYRSRTTQSVRVIENGELKC